MVVDKHLLKQTILNHFLNRLRKKERLDLAIVLLSALNATIISSIQFSCINLRFFFFLNILKYKTVCIIMLNVLFIVCVLTSLFVLISFKQFKLHLPHYLLSYTMHNYFIFIILFIKLIYCQTV